MAPCPSLSLSVCHKWVLSRNINGSSWIFGTESFLNLSDVVSYKKVRYHRNKGTFSGTLLQTPEDRLIYLLHCSVCVDIDGVFTRALKLCWHCSKADNDCLSRWRHKHLQSQWVRPQKMLLLLLLPEKLLHLQVDISRTPSINTVVKTFFSNIGSMCCWFVTVY